ncbi:MAG: dicarboxylate/amino acid:cation symporter [Blastocatellia bacterium]|nr:dicarboxylate/amino acid:cation symporter [Chloracidobacterium sp.]MBL8186030.1 dicarboxylate/amino acid:cation symporter [Blastocatellia bacterium]HBE83585.1 dicarboxylate/amino acid:cation symporter [Blastocatellia bacterium]HRJ87996.1 dicarboxylate/amino acid:cation symporter [Pyrinomonadaceae bacterium]HRK49741.1 dicarboxylate/amino acid:cation symporter [Pyrinomonadaceae bacterium]
MAENEKDQIPPDDYERELTTDLDDDTPDKPKGMPLHTKILIGLLVGVLGGLAINWTLGGTHPNVVWLVSNITQPVGTVFLNLLLMIVVPLVFASLVVGVAGIGDIRKLGRIGLKSFAYCLIISAISVVIGLGLANTIRPGERISPEIATQLKEKFSKGAVTATEAQKQAAESAKSDSPLMQAVKTIVPSNVFNSISGASPNMLHIMFFALIVGIAITLLPSPVSAPFVGLMESVFAITSKIIDIIMKFAPYAVACLIFNNIAQFGLDLLQSLAWFVVTVLLGLGLHFFGVYSLSVYFLSRINPLEFFKRIRTVIVTAFSTSSSNATLPTALRISHENLGVPKEINSFVLTVGATANQNGTALYEGVTVLFLAQLAGVDLSFSVQLMVVYLAILGGIGTAGVPSGSIPFIIGILAMIGIDPALIAIILGVDRILDMCRTTLNVVGDLTAATFVARSEGFELLKVREDSGIG